MEATFALQRDSEIIRASELLGSEDIRLLVIKAYGRKSELLEILNSRPT
jgi:hypothetical protein